MQKLDRLTDPKPDGILFMVRIDPEIAAWIDHRASVEKVSTADVLREIIGEEYEHMAFSEKPFITEGE